MLKIRKPTEAGDVTEVYEDMGKGRVALQHLEDRGWVIALNGKKVDAKEVKDGSSVTAYPMISGG